jgi:DNA-binding response OmpR family regulator
MALVGRRIMVVEDEYFIAQDIADSLRGDGATVLGPFADLSAARVAVESEAPDFAILDINLHGTMVFELAAEMLARGISFVFATGYEPPSIPAQFAAIPVWRKPFATTELAAALAGVGPPPRS